MTKFELAKFIQKDPSLSGFIERSFPEDLRSQLDVEDILQQVFIAASSVLQSYQGVDDELLRSWLKRVALHRIISAARARRSRPCLNDADLHSGECGPDDQRAPMSTPSSTVARREVGVRLLTAIRSLSPHQQRVVQLYALDRAKPAAVAKLLQIEQDAMHSTFASAKARLCRLMGSASKYFND